MKDWTNTEKQQMREFLEEILTQNGVEIDENRFSWEEEFGEDYTCEDHLCYWIDDRYLTSYTAINPEFVAFCNEFYEVTEYRRSLK